MRLHRLVAIILLLESRGIVKANELAHALETSERTIYRDIDVLCESGLPIKSEPGPTGGFSFMKGYRIDERKLNCDDIINLFLCGIGVRPAEYSENAITLRNTILKLENSIPKEFLPDVIKAKNRFYFDPSPWWDEVKANPMTDTIRRSLWKTRKLQLVYFKSNGSVSDKVINPYGLVVKNSEWYLIGYCNDRNKVIGLKCDRIKEASELDEEYSIPKDFSLESFWKDWVKEFKDITIKNEYKVYPVKIIIADADSPIPEQFEILEVIDKEGYKIITINLGSFINACDMLFTFSDKIAVVYPEEVRNYILGKASKIVSIYETNTVKLE